MNRDKQARGFSLIELLIVVAVIGIIAAIAIPKLMASTRAANEASAIASLRLLIGAEQTYASAGGNGQYGHLGTLHDEKIIDGVLGGGGAGANTASKSGFTFQSTLTPSGPGTPAIFVLSANPTHSAPVIATGARRFGTDTAGVIYNDISDLDTVYVTQDDLTAGTSTPLNR